MLLIKKCSAYFNRFKTYCINQMVPAEVQERDSLMYWRVRILFAILFTTLILAAFAVGTAILLALKEKMWGLAVFDILCYLFAIALLIAPRIGYEIKASIALAMAWVVGVFVICSVGMLSGGPAYLFTFAVLVGVLLGSKAAIVAVMINGMTLAIIGWLMSTAQIGQAFPFFKSFQAMIAAGVNFLVLNLITAISVSMLVKGLVSSVEKEKELTRTLAQEHTHLLEAKDHLENEIEERKQTEKALRESEEKFRGLSDLLPQIVFETDADGKLTFVNQIAFDLMGYHREDFERGVNALDVIAPEDRPEAMVNMDRASRGEHMGGNEYTAVRKDGTRFPILVYSSRVMQEGKYAGLRGIIVDLTELKQAQNALRESEEKLARSKKMESLGLMAGGIAHDLNNILSGIVSYPELLLLELPDDSPLRSTIETIKASGDSAAAVVSDLLTVTRGVASDKEVSNLNAIIEEFLNSPEYRKLTNNYQTINHDINLAPDLNNISCSPVHIKKTLMNLTNNAAEAIEGKGRIVLSTANCYLDETLSGYDIVRPGEYVLLTVSDDGSGISPQDMERIFEPFYTKKVMGRSGTGLGLSVVWNTVQDHKGYINVESSEKGTVFELYFPVTRAETESKQNTTHFDHYRGSGQKILVVDDEERQREIAGKFLTRLGYAVESVSSGEAALEYLKDHSVDLMVIDMIMPGGMNGRQTYEKAVKIHPGQKAVITSGFAETEDVDAIQQIGAGRFIKKPYSFETIGMAIRKALGN
jgi:PAS domain S-box-containing protein